MDSRPHPDQVCAVCGGKRDEHGDKNHLFSLDGQLIPKAPGLPPRRKAPRERQLGTDMPDRDDPVARLTLRMIERMVVKGQLNESDLFAIFGGTHAPDRGQAGTDAADDGVEGVPV